MVRITSDSLLSCLFTGELGFLVSMHALLPITPSLSVRTLQRQTRYALRSMVYASRCGVPDLAKCCQGKQVERFGNSKSTHCWLLLLLAERTVHQDRVHWPVTGLTIRSIHYAFPCWFCPHCTDFQQSGHCMLLEPVCKKLVSTAGPKTSATSFLNTSAVPNWWKDLAPFSKSLHFTQGSEVQVEICNPTWQDTLLNTRALCTYLSKTIYLKHSLH